MLRVLDAENPLHREIRFAGGFNALPGERIGAILEEKLKPIDAVPTPFPSWNSACRDAGGGVGPGRGWHITLAARTGTGKSVIAANLAVRAIRHGEQAMILSLEMSGIQLETRVLGIASGIPLRKLEQGRDFDREALLAAGDRLAELTEKSHGVLHINEEPLTGLEDVLAAMKWAREVKGVRFFVVDYLQLASRNANDPADITEVSHEIRRLTQHLNVVTIALSQFNRSTSAPKERPTIFGLMGGSAIENDSDQVVILDHSRIERAPAPLDGWVSYLILDKNRHGPLVEIPIHFCSRTLRVSERLPDELE